MNWLKHALFALFSFLCLICSREVRAQVVIGGQRLTATELMSEYDLWESEVLKELFRNNRLQDEIEISETQVDELKAKLKELEVELEKTRPRFTKEEIAKFTLEDNERAVKEQYEHRKMFFVKRENVCQEVLTPKQIQQLREATFWNLINQIQNFRLVFLVPKVQEAIGLEDSDYEELNPKLEELEKEFQEKVRKLRVEYHQKAVDLLPKEKRSAFLKTFGKPSERLPEVDF